MRRMFAALAFAALLLPHVVLAQAPVAAPQVRVRGVIETVEGRALVVKQKDGQSIRIVLPPEIRINAVERRTLASIKPGDFVGTVAVPAGSNQLRAREIHILPPAAGTASQGQTPWDTGGPGTTMTNAIVGEVAVQASGRILSLHFKDQIVQVRVPPHIPIVAVVAGGRRLLKAGAGIIVFGASAPDGTVTAHAVIVGKGHTKPQM
jgi:hypothetical protein